MNTAMQSERGRIVMAGIAWSILIFSFATVAAAACIRPKADCSSSGWFCQGTTTACERGWEDADVGYQCTKSDLREGRCGDYSSCAPYPCSQSAPPGSLFPMNCRNGGQCCSCTVFSGNSWGSGTSYWFYSECVGCGGTGGGDD
jgi:hypothetical protein